MISLAKYPGGVWLCDFEFRPKDGVEGNPPEVVCMVAREYFSGRTIRLWADELEQLKAAPFPIDQSALFVAFYASADLGCFLSLGWALPHNILDLFTAFRVLTNGKKLLSGSGLVGALAYFGISSIPTDVKESLRNRVLAGGPWDNPDKIELLNYCESDVYALQLLLPKLTQQVTPFALLQGQYSLAVAYMENIGVPLDVVLFNTLRNNWPKLKSSLILEVDKNYGVFEGESFRTKLFQEYLRKNNIPWPIKTSGLLDLSDDTFAEMATIYPQLTELRELRVALSRMRLFEIPIGSDGRNRCLLSYFRSVTGRNQPSSSMFIFGPSTWLRGFIKPPEGYALAYIDWGQQEFGIAGALSKDPNMMAAYSSGDPYLTFAKQAGAVPENATKKTHALEREQFKQCVLAVQYGMGAESLALRIKQPVARARQLLQLHRTTYNVFWAWSDRVCNQALLGGRLWTAFGWERHINAEDSIRSLQNFPMQSNGSEMLRLACIRLFRDGVRVCCPVHDAILIEAPIDQIEEVVAHTQKIMRQASAAVLDGFELSSDAKIIKYPNRYMDPRGITMWNRIMRLLGLEVEVNIDRA